MRLLRPFFYVVGLLPLLASCDTCGSYEEPKLNLFISSPVFFQIDAISAQGTTATFPQPDLKTQVKAIQLALPLSLVTDSTRYTLRINGKPETLTVHYRRSFAYRDRKCGYQTDLNAPVNKTQAQQVQTSFGKISFLNYIPSQTGPKLFGGIGTDDASIYLNISL